MRFLAVLNRDGGTLSTMDISAFAASAGSTLEAAGHSVDFRIVDGSDVVAALNEAAAANNVDVVMAGGGDGTVSAAAATLMNGQKALAVLPAGTMNLFARGLRIPLQLDAAIEAFAGGEVRPVDIATANGRPFVHQFSIGMHSELIRRREAMNYASRLGKLRASTVAAAVTIARPPRLRLRLILPSAEIEATVSSLGVSNNTYAEGHLPVVSKPDGGELGIYISRAHRGGELARLLLSIAAGRWKRSTAIEIHRAPQVEIRLIGRARRFQCAIDGELHRLDTETTIVSHPGALLVLTPRAAEIAEGQA